MGSNTINLKFVTELKELNDARAYLRKMAKEAESRFQKQFKSESDASVKRKRQLIQDHKIKQQGYNLLLKHNKDEMSSLKMLSYEKMKLHKNLEREESKKNRVRDQERKKEEKFFKFINGSGGNRGMTVNTGVRDNARALGRMTSSLAGGLWGFLTGGMTASYGNYIERERARGQIIGMGPFDDRRMAGSSRMGFNSAESLGHAAQMGRATGYLGVSEIQNTMRATGMESGQTAEMFQVLRQGGAKFEPGKNGSQGQKQFQKIMAGAFETGLEEARFPEYAEGVLNIVKSVSGTTGGNVNVDSINAIMRAFNKSGSPGLEGSRGATVLGNMNQLITSQGGGNEWMKGLIMRSLDFGTPGGGMDYAGVRRLMDQGVSGVSGGKTTLERLLRQALQESDQDPTAAALKLSAPGSGNTFSQMEDLLLKMKGGKLDFAKAAKEIDASKMTAADRAAKAMEESGGTLQKIADKFDDLARTGEQWAAAIQRLEELQRQLFTTVAGWAKKLLDTGVLQEMAENIRRLASVAVQFFSRFGISPEEAVKAGETAKEQLASGNLDAAARSALEATKGSTTPGVLDTIKNTVFGEEFKKVSMKDMLTGKANPFDQLNPGEVAAEAARKGAIDTLIGITDQRERNMLARVAVKASSSALSLEDIPGAENLEEDIRIASVQARSAANAMERHFPGIGKTPVGSYTTEQMAVFNNILIAIQFIAKHAGSAPSDNAVKKAAPTGK